MNTNSPLISVGIVSYLHTDDLNECLSTLYTHHKEDIDSKNIIIYICDNSPNDSILTMIQKNHPYVTIVQYGKNNGFGSGHNSIIKSINSKYHLILNPDIIFDNEVILSLADILDNNKDIEIITPDILNLDFSRQHLPRRYPKIKYVLSSTIPLLSKHRTAYTMADQKLDKSTDIDVCTGSFMLTRSDRLKELGGFDERFFMYFEDFDLSLRLKRYGRTIFEPKLSVRHKWHRESKSSRKMLSIQIKSMFTFYRKWGIKL